MYGYGFVKQIIETQKASFDTTYQAAMLAQERAEMLTDLFFQQISWIPSEAKRLFGQWSDNVKQGQKELKKTIDRNFDALLSAKGIE